MILISSINHQNIIVYKSSLCEGWLLIFFAVFYNFKYSSSKLPVFFSSTLQSHFHVDGIQTTNKVFTYTGIIFLVHLYEVRNRFMLGFLSLGGLVENRRFKLSLGYVVRYEFFWNRGIPTYDGIDGEDVDINCHVAMCHRR